MPLLIIQTDELPSVYHNIREIVRCDDHLGDIEDPNEVFTVDVWYPAKTSSGVGQDQVFALNERQPKVVIQGVGPTYLLPAPYGVISQYGGVTYQDGIYTRVIYDVSSSYYVFGTGGGRISLPGAVLLFHELAHAWHITFGDAPKSLPAQETQARTDENKFRSQVGLSPRDVSNNNGGLGSAPVNEKVPDCDGTGTWDWGCFVVSAAYKSALAPEVALVQDTRDGLAEGSLLADAFVRNLMAEYYTFSPRVAASMESDDALSDAITTLLVAPLLSFPALRDAFESAEGHNEQFLEMVGPLLETSRLPTSAETRAASDAANDFYARLRRRVRPAPRAQVSLTPNGIFDFLAQEILDGAVNPEYVTWLAGALSLFWRAVARLDDDTNALPRAIDEWLAAVPIPDKTHDWLNPVTLTQIKTMTHGFLSVESRAHLLSKIHTVAVHDEHLSPQQRALAAQLSSGAQ